MAKSLSQFNMVTCLDKYVVLTPDILDGHLSSKYNSLMWLSIGQNDNYLTKIGRIYKKYNVNVVVDVANGHREQFVKFCADVRNECPASIITAGNVCIPEMVQELIIHGGVDIVKVGIGSGYVCRTRDVTGVGYPQLSAVSECANVAHGLKSGDRRLGLIMSDGGCRTPGDIAKAFCAGADFVMIGTMLAGTDECLNKEEIYSKGKVQIYGMSSHLAQEKHGEQKEYRASEGDVIEIDYKGPVGNVVREILGGLRSCATYIGATSLKDFSKCATFVRIK